MVQLNNDWDELLKDEFSKDYYLKIRDILIKEYSTAKIYPDKHHIFDALKQTSYKDTKVVILGQDPYHGANQAHGLAFSVKPGVTVPPSLKNIYKELQEDVGCYIPNNGYLMKWATQGVLLLNTVLTVRDGEPNSHKNIGWQLFTDTVISHLNERQEPIVFLLWGANAKSKVELITSKQHHILIALHPSPLSAFRGFFGCRHFSKTNSLLTRMKREPIDWQIPNI